MYEERFYREKHKSSDLVTYQVMIEESDLMISSDRRAEQELKSILGRIRDRIRKACDTLEGFEKSLVPLHVQTVDPIIQQMLTASEQAQVGPMAAVAGTVSEHVAKEAIKSGLVSQIIVENGGDIYMASDKERKILIYAGDSPFSNRIGLRISESIMPIGVCTSAGTVGHSLSFGRADAVVILAKDTALADATATSVGNLVRTKGDIQRTRLR